MNNERFERIKAKHPDWSDEQIWMAVSIDMQQDATIDQKGDDIDPNDPNIWEVIITKAKDWLSEVLPVVFEKVKEVYTNLLNQIKEWVSENLPIIIEKVRDWLAYYFARS